MVWEDMREELGGAGAGADEGDGCGDMAGREGVGKVEIELLSLQIFWEQP